MAKIFISYRRADSRKDAGRIYDRLVQAFGKDNIFKDVDDIPIGSDFRGVLAEAVSQCDVLLALIGQHWLTVKDTDGNRRLDSEGDFVRIEVQTGLQRDKCLVVPVLVDNAPMPSAIDLPDRVRELAFKNAIIVRDDPDFHPDVTRLIDKLKQQFGNTVKPPPEKPQKFNARQAIAQFYEAFDNRDWEHARELLAQIRESGKMPRVFDADAMEQAIWDAISEQEAEEEYNILRIMVQRDTPDRVWSALQIFWESFPDYDPDNIAERVRPVKIQILPPDVFNTLPAPFGWCEIPAGEVTIDYGVDDLRRIRTYQVDLFFMARYPITNAQYQVFVDASDGYQNTRWWGFSESAELWYKENPEPKDSCFKDGDLPRETVTWYEGMAFCHWLSRRTGTIITLPTEMQWQRTSRGDDDRVYPWGYKFHKSWCNTRENQIIQTTPVTLYPIGSSPFGVFDMTGNVSEWTLTYWDEELDVMGYKPRVLCGESWNDNVHTSRSVLRIGCDPYYRSNNVGFRVVCAVPI